MTSAIGDVKIGRDDPALLHDQLAGPIRRGVAEREAKPGERLPPARRLAAVCT
jgi:GntR family transcriptional regulator